MSPYLTWAAWMVRFSCSVNLFMSIQRGENGEVGCALGILERGEMKAGWMMYL